MVVHKYVSPLDPPYVAPKADTATTTSTPADTRTDTPADTPASTIPTDSDIQALGELINSLAPAELAKLRIIAKQVAPEIAEAAGIDSNIRKLANGMIEAKIILSPDVIEMLIPWSESAQKSLGETIQDVAEMAITSLLSTDWGAIVPQAVAPPAVKV